MKCLHRHSWILRFPGLLVTGPYLALLVSLLSSAVEIHRMGGSISGLSPGLLATAIRVDVGGHELRLGCDGLTDLLKPLHCQVISVDGRPLKCAPLGSTPELRKWQTSHAGPMQPSEGWGSQPTLAAFVDHGSPRRTLAAAVSFVHELEISSSTDSPCTTRSFERYKGEQGFDWILDADWSAILIGIIPHAVVDYAGFWLFLAPGLPRCSIGPSCI